MRRIREEVKSSFYGKKRQKRSHRRRKYTTSVFKHAAILFQISPFCNKTCSQMILITSDAKVITFATKHVNDELSLVLERKMRKVLLSLRVLLHSNHSYAEYKVTTLYSWMLLHPNGKLDKNRDFRLKGWNILTPKYLKVIFWLLFQSFSQASTPHRTTAPTPAPETHLCRAAVTTVAVATATSAADRAQNANVHEAKSATWHRRRRQHHRWRNKYLLPRTPATRPRQRSRLKAPIRAKL